MQLVHSPYAGPLSDSEQRNGNVQPIVRFTSNTQFILAIKETVQVWRLQRVMAKDQVKYRWQIVHEFSYRGGCEDVPIVQVIDGIRMRLRPYKAAVDDRCLVLVHQGADQTRAGRITFWR